MRKLEFRAPGKDCPLEVGGEAPSRGKEVTVGMMQAGLGVVGRYGSPICASYLFSEVEAGSSTERAGVVDKVWEVGEEGDGKLGVGGKPTRKIQACGHCRVTV